MPNTTTTPNMGMVLPVPTVELGPAWATELITALTNKLDAHNHTAGLGLQVPTAGLLINADLSYLSLGTSYNAKDLRSTRYTAQGSALILGSDVGCLYNVNGDAYWNNGAGTAIQLTKSGAVNSTALLWPLHPGAAGGTIQPTDPYLIYYADTTTSPLTFNLPASSALAAGRTYVFIDIKNNTQTNSITLAPNGTDKIAGVNANFVIASNGSATMVTTDAAGNWYVFQWPYQSLVFPGGFSPLIGQAPTSAATGNNFTLQSQASTNANGTAGNINLNTPAPTGSGGTAFTNFLSGGTIVGGVGAWNNSTNFAALYLGVTPASGVTTNFTLLGTATGAGVQLNAPSGKSLFLEIATQPLITLDASAGQNVTFFNAGGLIAGAGQTVIGIANRVSAPSSNPTGGGVLYSENGAQKWRGSGGAINTVAATGAGTQNTCAGIIDETLTFARTTATGATFTVDTPVPTTTTIMLRFVVIGRNVSGTGTVGDTEAHTREATFKNIAGTVTQVGATTTVSNFSDANMNGSVAIAPSGTNARITVTAPALEGATPTIDWSVLITPLVN